MIGTLSQQYPFEQQSCAEPQGGIVQTDQMPDIPTTAAVVPGTELPPFQEASREILCGENQAHICDSTDPERLFTQQAAEGSKDGGAAVDGEHPDGSDPFEGHIPAAEGIQRGKHDFHTPAGEAAFHKIVEKGKQSFFHGSSHSAA